MSLLPYSMFMHTLAAVIVLAVRVHPSSSLGEAGTVLLILNPSRRPVAEALLSELLARCGLGGVDSKQVCARSIPARAARCPL